MIKRPSSLQIANIDELLVTIHEKKKNNQMTICPDKQLYLNFIIKNFIIIVNYEI